MRKVIHDTDVYVDWLNTGRHGDVLFAKGFLKYLSAVVLLELEAGTFSKRDQRLIEKLAKGFDKADRIVVPSASDYREGGRLLQRLQEEKGYDLSKAYSLVNDVLIALSARRIGAMVITQNAKDFEAIRELRPFPLMLV